MNLSTPAKVGIITMIALVLLSAMIVWKSDILLISRGYEVIASFGNTEGLNIGSEVRFRGTKIGKVEKIDPGPYDTKVYSVVDKSIKIPFDSKMRVSYDGLVGTKFLEILPGVSTEVYVPPEILQGKQTSSMVDFIDIGAKNLEETKAILNQVRNIVENPKLQQAFINAVYATEKTAEQAEKLTEELRQTIQGIKAIVTDPKFQANVKDTMSQTQKTLSSANQFFDGMGKLKVRASGGVDLGTKSNAVRVDVDIIQSENVYFRLGVGQGPAPAISLLDFLYTSKLSETFGYRLGMINSSLGGGVFFTPQDRGAFLADIYDINNPKPNLPKVRLGYQRQIQDYVDLLLQADDIMNSGSTNFMLGIRVKPLQEKLF